MSFLFHSVDYGKESRTSFALNVYCNVTCLYLPVGRGTFRAHEPLARSASIKLDEYDHVTVKISAKDDLFLLTTVRTLSIYLFFRTEAGSEVLGSRSVLSVCLSSMVMCL